MKFRHVIVLTLLILLIDQALKIWVKTSFYYGEERLVLGNWFRLHFIENAGMAYGWKFGGEWGKVILTLFRLLAVIFGTYYIYRVIQQGYHRGFVICATLIYAGAIGNLIDSLFYGIIFDKGMLFDPTHQEYMGYSGLAEATGKGYSSFLHGNVVDMLYFPIITDAHFPTWFPIWGGESFEFFRPVFNIADASISIGVITILIFQRRFFPDKKKDDHPTVESPSPVNDGIQVPRSVNE